MYAFSLILDTLFSQDQPRIQSSYISWNVQRGFIYLNNLAASFSQDSHIQVDSSKEVLSSFPIHHDKFYTPKRNPRMFSFEDKCSSSPQLSSTHPDTISTRVHILPESNSSSSPHWALQIKGLIVNLFYLQLFYQLTHPYTLLI